ncbi:MAG: ferritin-like domain-containing protein [Gammaproteobacteria bacterium]|nr:ferritin-like domain-containing protein [Gammaproteobacteria bacterium]
MQDNTATNFKNSINARAYHCLLLESPQEKVAQSLKLREEWTNGLLSVERDLEIIDNCDAGWPEKPELVAFNRLPKRTVGSLKGHASMMHSFAHIEFNAINIAWDAVYRFPDMPEEYYDDWSRIAQEEAYHFTLINDYLKSLDYEYGSFDAHKGLWEMVEETRYDVLVRMALVPRVLEARGLDVTPNIIQKFKHHGHHEAAEILSIIYRDEIGHVEVGTRWFNYMCNKREIDAHQTFVDLIERYAVDKIRQPFNEVARMKAGFSAREMEYLNQCSK